MFWKLGKSCIYLKKIQASIGRTHKVSREMPQVRLEPATIQLSVCIVNCQRPSAFMQVPELLSTVQIK